MNRFCSKEMNGPDQKGVAGAQAATPGPTWPLLVPSDLSWPHLISPVLSWPHLASPGPTWPLLTCLHVVSLPRCVPEDCGHGSVWPLSLLSCASFPPEV